MKLNIKQATLVMSGKGGVGKSTLCSQLAISIAMRGLRVGILDVDICGPSLARMFNVEQAEIVQTESGWSPVKVNPDIELHLITMAFLTNNKNSALIWRGPKKHSMIEKFLTEVNWGKLDNLIVDTPPGTSDEHISLIELLTAHSIPIQVLLVTTPQVVACNDVRREISFCKASRVPILGIVENMSGYTCPHCSECTKLFSSKGGEALSQLTNLKFLGTVPIDPELCRCAEEGKSFIEKFKESQTALVISNIAETILDV